MIVFTYLISLFIVLKSANGARILGVYPMAWGSHYILGIKLMKGLAEAGHDITMITPYPTKDIPKHGNWTDVVLDGLHDQFKDQLFNIDFLNSKPTHPLRLVVKFLTFSLAISNGTFHHPRVKKLIESDTTFDAVIIDQFMNECHHVFGYLFKAPLVLVNTMGPTPLVNAKVGNAAPVSTVSNTLNETPGRVTEMGFIDRLKNLFFGIGHYLMTHYYILPLHDQVIHEAFPDAPSLDILYYNVSLVLLNSHTSMIEAVPLVPNMVEVGGFHIEPPKKLPDDLQEFLDNATDGAIYFSFGSELKSTDLPVERKKVFLDLFRTFKQKVLWKFEDDLPGKPNNVLIKSWMPQQDILAHPNVKLLITHGGLLSSTEAIYHGVPVLCLPLFGDQIMNSNKAVQGGFGLKLGYYDEHFNEKTLRSLIEELLYNPRYAENAQKRSKIYHDRPMTPMQTAVYWVEYIIRHSGALNLRVAGVGMPWYKYFMIDVLVLLISLLLVVLFSFKFLISRLVRAFSNKNKRTGKLKLL